MSSRLRVALVFIVLAGGFASMAIEVRYLHRDILGEYWQATIPIIYSAVATLACLLALSSLRWTKTIVACIMGAGVLVGGFGTFLHSEGEASAFQRLLSAAITARASEDEAEYEEGEEEAPVLAPLGIGGLSMVGLLMVLPEKRGKRSG